MSSESIEVTLLCVGDELTEGRSQDAHGAYLATFFRERGFRVRRVSLVPDDYELYSSAVSEGLRESRVVVCTGGLGPTQDDLTREVIAECTGRELRFHDELWGALVRRLSNRRISETNKKQAYVPNGFDVFPNPNGTAVGFAGESEGTVIVALPGPPSELHPMVHDSLERYLEERFQLPLAERLVGTTFAVAESDLEEALQRYAPSEVRWGTKAEELRIAFSLRGGMPTDRERTLAGLQEEFGTFHVRAGDIDPVEDAFEKLTSAGKRLVTAESCTGGLVAKVMTDRPGSSDVFGAGIVVYENEAKRRILGVPSDTLTRYGAVSRETVDAMADAAVALGGPEEIVSVAISGIAGPGGGTEEKPVGTVWIAASDGSSRVSRGFLFVGTRGSIRRKAVAAALLLVSSLLIGGAARS